MKVWELMAKLADMPSGADVQCCTDDNETYGILNNVSFDGTKAEDAYVDLGFKPTED